MALTMKAGVAARAVLAEAIAAFAPCSHVSGMVRSSPCVLGTLGEPSVTTNMILGASPRSLALLPTPVLMPADVGVRPVGPLRALTAVLKVASAT